jgi:Uma2 family endonuclease
MSHPAKLGRRATYEDLENLSDNVVGEIIDGELFVSPRPAPKHAVAASGIIRETSSFSSRKGGSSGGWWIIVEPEIRVSPEALVPDVAGWKRERMPKIPDGAHFEIIPDWVCEVLSPSNARLDRVKKVPKYAELGVKHLWLVDPIAKTLEVFRLESGRWVLLQTFADNDKVKAEPFESTEMDLSNLWAD